MFRAISRLVTRRAKSVVACWVVIVALCAAWAFTGFGGEGLFDRLVAGNLPTLPGTESQAGRDIMSERGQEGDAVIAMVDGLDMAKPEMVQAVGQDVGALTKDLMDIDGVATVINPYVFKDGPTDPQAASFLSNKDNGFLLVASLKDDLDKAESRRAQGGVIDRLTSETFSHAAAAGADAKAHVSSGNLIENRILDQMQKDLMRGELISLPFALLIMIVVFGGFLAASLPLIGALASIAVGMGVLLAATHVTTIESFVMTIVTVLGLGLSIDYGLLIVNRFREEVHLTREALAANGGKLPIDMIPTDLRSQVTADEQGRATLSERDIVRRAVRLSVVAAGRTVAFSALTVAISIAGLLFLKPDILRSLSLGGVIIVLLAVLASVTLVPALMTLFGPALLGASALGRVPGLRQIVGKLGDVAPREGVFSRLARFVHRHPWVILTTITALLVVLALPIRGMSMRSSDIQLLPHSTELRETYETMQVEYPTSIYPDVTILAKTDEQANLAAYTQQLSRLPHVEQARISEIGDDGYSIVQVFAESTDPGADQVVDLVHDIRGLDPGFETWSMGAAASQIDFQQNVADGLAWAGLVVVVATFLLLFLMTGSILIPIKALLMNIISLLAALGATTWIFESGHLSGLIGTPAVGGLENYVVAVIVAFGFGLAMDYEVFLLSRIKEGWDFGHDNDAAVEFGLQHSGRIITSAALIMIAVFLGFAVGDLVAIKQVGVGLAVTVFIDATLVRMLLVPATMTLLGKWNWWAPAWMTKIYQRFAIEH